ncbi:uncharacterized protein DUF2480 [Kordia periserrulae]|uniref:Uncharacterized protein DUF2480 n=1 Tax=Kordia periserrulae TaxID=701523 RepID=A0A2T6C6T6_9FLAO|nr:DUF2480 family protein [Kordia periserrulae]PTX64041.1 uncharacterized protein DUF2480 [Kordia periserrulae]
MADEIINRVAQSKLVTFDLEDYYPAGERVQFDISQWLLEGLILREKEFRNHVATHDWSQYQGTYVALHCSTDAIIPGWAFMLISVHLAPFVEKVVIGSLENLETVIYQEIIYNLDVSEYQDKPVIIKGCANKPIPDNAYTMMIAKLHGVAKSIMYGEACSSVPLYKKKKTS